jgi:hypothetical protein
MLCFQDFFPRFTCASFRINFELDCYQLLTDRFFRSWFPTDKNTDYGLLNYLPENFFYGLRLWDIFYTHALNDFTLDDFILWPFLCGPFSFASSGLCTFTPRFPFATDPSFTLLVLSSANQGHSDVLDWTILFSPRYSGSLAPVPRLGRFA